MEKEDLIKVGEVNIENGLFSEMKKLIEVKLHLLEIIYW